MLVHKDVLQLAEIGEEDFYRGSHDGILIKDNEAVASDNRCALKITLPDQTLLGEYPAIPKNMQSMEDPVYLPKDTIKKIASNMPKKVKVPILEHFCICKGEEQDRINIVINDIDIGGTIVINQKTQDIHYSNIANVFKSIKAQEPIITVRLSISLLERVLKTIKKIHPMEEDQVRLSLYDKESPIHVEINDHSEALIMPVKE